MIQRNRRHPFLALFDAADPNVSVPLRLPTTTPTQSLYLLNSPFVLEQANAFAKRLLAAPGDDATRIQLAIDARKLFNRIALQVEGLNRYPQGASSHETSIPLRDAAEADSRLLDDRNEIGVARASIIKRVEFSDRG